MNIDILSAVSAALYAAKEAIFSSIRSFGHQPFTPKQEERTMSKANLTSVMLIFAAVLLALAMGLPQPVWAQGAGRALYFDGSNDYVSIPDDNSLDIGSQITVEAWIRFDEDPYSIPDAEVRNYIADKPSEGGFRFWYSTAGEDSSDSDQFFFENWDWDGVSTKDITWEIDKWYHLAGTYDGSTAKIYVNGVLNNTATYSKILPTSDEPLYIGAGETTPERFWHGDIDEVRIWDVALDSSTIRTWMCKKVTSSHPNWSNLKGYWRFDEGSGTTAYDQTANNNDGTLTNGPTWVWSGAAIGDTSAYDYDGTNPGDFTASISHGDGDSLTATGSGGTVNGIQVYRVDATSMRTDATKPDGWTLDANRYWGVFITGTGPTYTVTYNYDNRSDISNENTLGLAFRKNNNDDNWKDTGATLNTSSNTLTKTGQTGTEYSLANPAASIEYTGGKALDLDGVNDIIETTLNINQSSSSSGLTMEAWVYPTSTSSGRHQLISSDNGGFDWSILREGDGWYVFSGSNSFDTGYNLDLNKWQYLAAVFTPGSGVRFYKNGVDTLISDISYDDSDNNIALGGNPGPWNEYFQGIIDEVRIWDVALDSSTIRTWMCKKVTSSHPNWSNLQGYWRFDESSGTSCDDYSQNSNMGTMIDMDPATDRLWSGAAIGDESAYDYDGTNPGDFSASVSHSDGDQFTATGEDGTVTGIQVYRADTTSMRTDATKPSGWTLDPNRYWGVFITGTTPTYTVVYNYNGHAGISNENDLDLAVRDDQSDDSWADANATLSTTDHTLTLTGQTGTEYALGSQTADNSLPVTLTSFTAVDSAGVVVVRWTTESELENAWFYLYRSTSPEGQYLRIAQIPGRGTTSSRHEYRYTDRNLTPGQSYWYKLADVSYRGESTWHGPIEVLLLPEELPSDFALEQNYPNPFNPATAIKYQLPQQSYVSLSVYNTQGQLVRTLVKGREEPGYKSVHWDGRDNQGHYVASGVYLYVLKIDGRLVQSRKMAVLR